MRLSTFKLLGFFLVVFGFLNELEAQCPLPDPTTTDDCIFNEGQASLSASGSSGFYNWYNNSSGDSIIATGSTYQTPYLTSSQTFYAAASDTNTALQFDGNNDYVALNASYNSVGALPVLTVEAWVKTSVGGVSYEFDNWSIVDFDRSEYFNLFVNATTGGVGFSTYSNTGGIDDFYSGPSVNDGAWHHIAAVYDGVDKIIYIDGVEVARKNNPHGGDAIGSGTTRFGILGDGSESSGFNAGRNNLHYDGFTDEVRLWNDVRTPAEINNFKDTCLNGSESNLQLYFNFNENGGTALTDISGNGGDGTLFNFNLPGSWVSGALVKCDCESNLVPAVATVDGNLQDTLLTCSAPSITLDAGSSASSYLWSTGATSQTITVNQSGFYEVTTSGGTCDGSTRIAVDGFTHAEDALLFDGGNDYAAIRDMYYEGSDYSALTVETWVKTTNGGDQILASFDRSEYWRLEINGDGAGNGQVGFDLRTSSGITDFGSSARVDDGLWHHVACVFDSGVLSIYIDGILDASTTTGSLFGTGGTRYGFLGTGSESTVFDGSRGPSSYFDGEMDEFRIWNRALSQTEIRDNMSRHRSGKSSGLEVYYKFDDMTNDTIFDHNTNVSNDAVMRNFGAGQVISAAPVGDESVYVYTGGAWGGVTSSINSCDGETFTLSNMSGSPDGVHLYYVNNFPNDVSGLSGGGTYDRYFGVNKINDPAATYTATYNYTGNPYVSGTNESTIELFRRPDNATFPWVNTFGTLDIGTNTIAATGQNTEFIIDYVTPLPVDLVSFSGMYQEKFDRNALEWETASEVNCDFYLLEKSYDGHSFKVLDTIAGTGNTNESTKYVGYDTSPRNGVTYYRLKQFDFDGAQAVEGIIAVKKTLSETTIYPNPVEVGGHVQIDFDLKNDQLVQIELHTANGMTLKKQNVEVKSGAFTVQLRLDKQLTPGIYTLVLYGKDQVYRKKLIVY